MKLYLTLIAAVILLVGIGSCSKYREATVIIKKIDDFKSRNQRLPQSLSEIGVPETEEGPIYYTKLSDNDYIVWFGTDLGESETYYSETRGWEP